MHNGEAIQSRFQGHFSYLVLIIGACFMIAAAFLLIQGLSRFSGDSGSQNIFIVFGVLFQIGESVCFIAAARQSHHSKLWRAGLLMLGIILFSFSISVMTLAQKATMQVGINAASAVDEQRNYLREQIESLDRSINSYRFNAESQSKSIYKDSRALGQDSLNRTIELEEKKRALSDQLFALSNERRESSADFFARLETIVGWPADTTEFYFLVLRSVLIELCGVLFLAYGSYSISVLPAPVPDRPAPATKSSTKKARKTTTKKTTKATTTRKKTKPASPSTPVQPTPATQLPGPTLQYPDRLENQSKNVFSLTPAKSSPTAAQQREVRRRLSYEESAQAVIAAMEAGHLTDMKRDSIKAYLSVGDGKANKVLELITEIQNDRAAGKTEITES